ncbi:Rhs-family protein, partial [hydrothermal vent metagenome]
HLDHLGTPRELTNNEGDIVWKVRYKSWGNVALKECEEIENNIRFQGQYFDEETGLHYNRHRYYNPDTGQFISQDPIGLLGGVNNYQYAPNPLGWIDPLGLCKDQVDTRPKKTKGGRDIVYFTQDDIEYENRYDQIYKFHVDDGNSQFRLATTTVFREDEALEFYINNSFHEGVLLKSEGFGITDEIISQSIDIYTDTYGKPPEFLNGTIIKSNLSNFQKEYSKIKKSSPGVSDDAAANEAIKKISFGKSRVKLGYDDFTVDTSFPDDVKVDGEILKGVPSVVSIKAGKKGKNKNE